MPQEDNQRTYEGFENPNEDLVLVNDKTVLESTVSWILKSIFYSSGYISMIPKYLTSFVTGKNNKKKIKGRYIVSSDGNSKVLRRADHPEYLLKYDCHYKSVQEIFRMSVEKFSDKKYMGSRSVISERDYYDENLRRSLKKQTRGEYDWITYKEAGIIVNRLATSLNDLNLPPRSHVAIFADTRKEWLLSMFATLSLGHIIVTVYSMLTDDSITYCLNFTDVEVIFTDAKCFPRLVKNIDKIPKLKTIIMFDKDEDQSLSVLNTVEKGRSFNILYYEEISNRREEFDYTKVSESKPDDIAVIMFTSGSSAGPKGVKIMHKNIISMVVGITYDPLMWTSDEIYAAYLPLGHVMELVTEMIFTYLGSSIGYTSPLCLTDQSPMIEDGTKGDLTVLKPSLIIFVPLLLERIQAGILDQIKKRGRLAQTVFEFAFNYKRHFRKFGYTDSILDSFIFKKTIAIVGGILKSALVGGASVSVKTQEFVSICICANFIQGYGLTETTGSGAVCDFDDITFGHVGPPMPCCELKLIPWEEGGYEPHDKPNPRGEIIIHGDTIAAGYYKDQAQTDESFIEDPNTGEIWFHTGDIGEISPDGCLRIIDRKKDIIKLKHGEYVPLVKIENVFASSKYCARCCACPNQDSEYLILIVSLDFGSVKKLAASLYPDKPEMNITEMVADSSICDAVKKDLLSLSTDAKLNKFEIPKRFAFIDDVWTPDSDLVTPTFKLKRKNIVTRYETVLY